MQFDLRQLQRSGAKQTGGLFLFIFRFAAALAAFGLPLLAIVYPPEYDHDRTAFYAIWIGAVILLGIFLALLRFGKGMPAQGSVYKLSGDTLKIIYYNENEQFKTEETYLLTDLDFVHGGQGNQTASNTVSGVRLSTSVQILELGFKLTASPDFKVTLKLPDSSEIKAFELNDVAKKINAQIAKAKKISPEEIERQRKQYFESGALS